MIRFAGNMSALGHLWLCGMLHTCRVWLDCMVVWCALGRTAAVRDAAQLQGVASLNVHAVCALGHTVAVPDAAHFQGVARLCVVRCGVRSDTLWL